MSFDLVEKGRGLKSRYEFILLFKSLSFPPFSFKIKTHKLYHN